jgi:hypothetical protein
MFGSLVIVLPTAHEGGALLLRHRGHEWTFDSGQALGAEGQPSIAYVAFLSGIEHEVAPVTSGRRITLTYNLYFGYGGPVSADDSVLEHPDIPLANKGAFREAFTALLENPEFLTDGGTLAFGMRHVYSINDDTELEHVNNILKGSDAVVYQVVRALGYEPVLYMWYKENRCTDNAIIDEVLTAEEANKEEYGFLDIIQSRGGILLSEEGVPLVSDRPYWTPEQVVWVTRVTEWNRQDSYCLGSHLGVHQADRNVCLIVRIGEAGDRLAYPTVAELNEIHQTTGHADW